jgi:hypothetical protein
METPFTRISVPAAINRRLHRPQHPSPQYGVGFSPHQDSVFSPRWVPATLPGQSGVQEDDDDLDIVLRRGAAPWRVLLRPEGPARAASVGNGADSPARQQCGGCGMMWFSLLVIATRAPPPRTAAVRVNATYRESRDAQPQVASINRAFTRTASQHSPAATSSSTTGSMPTPLDLAKDLAAALPLASLL